ncbi:MAG: hypothetical protein PHV34_20270 [Verrucomicrobiae bacterium]|nr:hypothetical protein [Verrucomicrobiae bacterium]
MAPIPSLPKPPNIALPKVGTPSSVQPPKPVIPSVAKPAAPSPNPLLTGRSITPASVAASVKSTLSPPLQAPAAGTEQTVLFKPRASAPRPGSVPTIMSGNSTEQTVLFKPKSATFKPVTPVSPPPPSDSGGQTVLFKPKISVTLGAGAAPAPAPAAPVLPQGISPTVEIPLADLATLFPEQTLKTDSPSLPDKISLSLADILSQLQKGRILFSLSTLTSLLPPETVNHEIVTANDVPIKIPLHLVVPHIPETALALPSNQVKQEINPSIQTPFSENRTRLTESAAEVPISPPIPQAPVQSAAPSLPAPKPPPVPAIPPASLKPLAPVPLAKPASAPPVIPRPSIPAPKASVPPSAPKIALPKPPSHPVSIPGKSPSSAIPPLSKSNLVPADAAKALTSSIDFPVRPTIRNAPLPPPPSAPAPAAPPPTPPSPPLQPTARPRPPLPPIPAVLPSNLPPRPPFGITPPSPKPVPPHAVRPPTALPQSTAIAPPAIPPAIAAPTIPPPAPISAPITPASEKIPSSLPPPVPAAPVATPPSVAPAPPAPAPPPQPEPPTPSPLQQLLGLPADVPVLMRDVAEKIRVQLQIQQVLLATEDGLPLSSCMDHDTANAWSGIGAKLFRKCNQEASLSPLGAAKHCLIVLPSGCFSLWHEPGVHLILSHSLENLTPSLDETGAALTRELAAFCKQPATPA